MTKKIDHLRKHFRTGRSLTQLEALALYGVFRLAARVKEMKDDGWNLVTTIKRDPNGCPYAEYQLVTNDHGLPAFALSDKRVMAE